MGRGANKGGGGQGGGAGRAFERGREALEWANDARLHGKLDEAANAYHEALTAFEDAGHPGARLVALNALASLEQMRGQPHAAAARFQEALTLATQQNDAANAALLHGNLATLLQMTGALAEAEDHARRALGLVSRLGDDAAAGQHLATLGRIARQRGDDTAALRHLTESLRCFEDARSPLGQGRTLLALGDLAHSRGDPAAAEDAFQRAGGLLSSAGDATGAAQAVRGLGHVALRRGRLDDASRALTSALELLEQSGDLRGQSGAHFDLGNLAAARGALDAALAHHARALDLAHRAGAGDEVARIHLARGQLRFEQGDVPEALGDAAQASRAFAALGARQGEIGAAVLTAQLLLCTGRVEDGRAQLERALEAAHAAQLKPLEATVKVHLAGLRGLDGEIAEERRLLSDAAHLYRRAGSAVSAVEADLRLLCLEATRTGAPDLALACQDDRIRRAQELYERQQDAEGLRGIREVIAHLHRCHGDYPTAEAILRDQAQWHKERGRRLAWLGATGGIFLMRLRAGRPTASALMEGLAREAAALSAPLLAIGLAFDAVEAAVGEHDLGRARHLLTRWSARLASLGGFLVPHETRRLDLTARIAVAEGSPSADPLVAEAAARWEALEDSVALRELRRAVSGASPP